MCNWSLWPRRARDAERLDAAAERSDQIAHASADAHAALDAALNSERAQLRRNNLGQLAHDALLAPRRKTT